jgi:hypothetical protein
MFLNKKPNIHFQNHELQQHKNKTNIDLHHNLKDLMSLAPNLNKIMVWCMVVLELDSWLESPQNASIIYMEKTRTQHLLLSLMNSNNTRTKSFLNSATNFGDSMNFVN